MPLPAQQPGQHAAPSQQQQQQHQHHQQQHQHHQQYYYNQSHQHQCAQQQAQYPSPQDKLQTQPIGRSHSAFNFLLSKAKAPFSSSSSSSTLNASTSMSSLSIHQEDPFDDSTNHIQYHRQLQKDHTFPHAPTQPLHGRRMPSSSMDKTPRAHQQTENPQRQGSAPFARPSYSEEQAAVASPTKRGFFSGIGRDRKASTTSIKQPVPQKPNFSYSPLSKSQRPDNSTSSNYAQFSKSQSDLHTRADFPSPTNPTVELPRVPAIYQQQAPSSADRHRYLRSPSPAMNFSRSVDDLSSVEQPVSPFPASSGYEESTSTLATAATSTSPGTWGEHGVPGTQPDWRPSDMGTLASPIQQHSASFQRFKAGHSKLDSVASSIQPSTGSVQSPPKNWPSMSSPQHSYLQSAAAQRHDAKHARKASKLTGKEAGRAAVATSLAASFGLTNLGGSAAAALSLSNQTRSEPVPLPPGAVFQGFVSRNANISLTLPQLNHDQGKGKEKEKDIAKGWKPYRVVLQDGRLCFYKPPSSISDEVKMLFPTGVVRNVPDTPASSTSFPSLNTEALMKCGLSKQDLLSATSSTAEMNSPLPSPSIRPRLPALRQNSNKSTTEFVETQGTSNTAPLLPEVNGAGQRAWVQPGKHPDLILVDSIEAPRGWAERIYSGTMAALAHEFVKATQYPTKAEQVSASMSRRSIASPLPARTRGDGAGEAVVEAFVIALFASMSVAGEVKEAASEQAAAFISEVSSQAEESLLTAQDGSAVEVRPFTSLKSRLATLLDIAIRSGIAQAPAVSTAIELLAASAHLDGQDLMNKLTTAAAPILKTELIAAGEPIDWISRTADKNSSDTREDLRELRSSLSISDGLLLQLEPLEFAQQIHLFHADALRHLVGPHLSMSEIIETAKANSEVVAVFSFDSVSPHPLTAMALKHLLSSSPAGLDAASVSQNGARHRASVLRHWIAIASYLLTLGDVAGWMAVCAALCSRAVTRLEQTWRYLAEGDRVLVAEEWAPMLSSISWTEGISCNVRPRFVGDAAESFATLQDGRRAAAIPFLGNALYRILRPPDSLASASANTDHITLSSRAENAYHVWSSANEWRSAWQHSASELSLCIAGETEPLAEYQATLQLLFREAGQNPTSESNMERSFQLEPKALGNLDARERHQLPTNANPCLPLVPLVFPHPLPLLSLLNASQITAELFRRDDPHANLRSDPQTTVTSCSSGRPALAGSPLIRSSAFSPPLGTRSGRNAAFGGVIEWSSMAPTWTWEDANSNTMKIGNELVLRIIQEPNLSLPNSPITSKRFSQDFGRASRPLSQISKRSSLPASNRSSVVDIVVPVQVVVKAATLDRMIDLLVMGVQHIIVTPPLSAGDGSEVQNTPTRKTRLVMDMEAYRTTFLATFRSLCSPSELFEQLQKRFTTAITASKELAGADEFRTSSQFPSWIPLTPVGSQAEPNDLDMAYRIRMGVVLTLRLWIERFPQDFVDDDVLYHLALGFLRQQSIENTAEDADQRKVIHALAQLRSMFGARVMGANARQEERSYATDVPVQVSSNQHQAGFEFDRASAAELVEYLESIATVFFDKIVDRDLLVVSEIFEKQATHPAAWFTVKAGNTGSGEEDKPVTNMYTMLDVLRACDGSGKDARQDVTLQQKLPSAVRDALAAQSLFRGWIAIHIIESGIGLERRQERLSKLLDALWICRARMLRLRGDDVASSTHAQNGNSNNIADTSLPFREPTIGSFVESAIVNTLGSSESRIFLRAWQGVAAARGAKGDGLDDMMPIQLASDLRSATEQSGTPDIGWILACLAEVATKAPSVHASAADVELVDFEKRRTMWAIIDGAVRVRPACSVPDLVDLAGARLRLMQSALARVIWDRRAFREDAANEMRNAPPARFDARLRLAGPSKALPGLSKQQQEKLRRDRAALEMLNSLPLRPSISSRVSSMPSSTGRASAFNTHSSSTTPISFENVAALQTAPPDKATIRARRMTALFKGAVRPLISLDKPDAPAKSVSELMRLTPLQKPSIIAGLGGARVSVWINSQRSFIFHLTSQEGAKYLLQAVNAAELVEWIGHIERASKEYAVLRPMDARKAAVLTKTKSAPAPLYGRPLIELVEREGHSVPTAVERMFAEIEARGLREQGIYRISGSKSAVENLRRAWDQQPAECIDLSTGEFSDIHTIAGAVKTWLRELPEPLITFESYNALIATNAMENDDRLYAMRDIIWKMPKFHFDVLRRTAEHLARVVEEAEANKMLAHNIALVFGTSLLNPPPGPSSVAIGFGNLGQAANVVKTIVTMHEWLFEPEPEPEADVELDVEAQQLMEHSVAAEDQAGAGSTAVISPVEDEMAKTSAHLDLGRARGASLSSSNDSVPVHVDLPATLNGATEDRSSEPDAQNEEDEPLSELPVSSRRGRRARPLTIVGLDGLAALGGSDAVSKVLESGEASRAEKQAGSDDTETRSRDADEVTDAQADTDVSTDSQMTQAAPRIVLSGDAGNAIDDETNDETCTTPPQLGSKPVTADNDAEASSGLSATSERPRKTRSTYRDSVFTSYSIYTDCFDNMKLDSAAAMVKRQSIQPIGSSTNAASDVAASSEAKTNDA
ncbi:related to BEM2 - GTPase-activating protein [Melanopsichium pennsylvanicum]|uniref:Related to BEM2 - GTPase-activating protein n=2 Tax=Melanopsichium pennsylvanicum TaxID=63383 RepID=A0AAJ4XI46_9BASI|nr:related to BEM2-GTPase-activating protein [Melanopsichium pennsylvanicum 4]SNX82548.1 related to BEM2 - GTPase-activating protein [Melanopsichium pennsylvanicum]